MIKIKKRLVKEKTKDQIIKELNKTIRTLQKDKQELLKRLWKEQEDHQIRLAEARRHTIPMMQGDAMVNFHPLFVRSYKTETDPRLICHSATSAFPFASLVGSKRAVIECTGDILVFPLDGTERR